MAKFGVLTHPVRISSLCLRRGRRRQTDGDFPIQTIREQRLTENSPGTSYGFGCFLPWARVSKGKRGGGDLGFPKARGSLW